MADLPVKLHGSLAILHPRKLPVPQIDYPKRVGVDVCQVSMFRIRRQADLGGRSRFLNRLWAVWGVGPSIKTMIKHVTKFIVAPSHLTCRTKTLGYECSSRVAECCLGCMGLILKFEGSSVLLTRSSYSRTYVAGSNHRYAA